MIAGRLKLSRFLATSSRCFAPRPQGNMAGTLETLHFDNLALRSLPLDQEQENYVRRVSGACFSLVDPTPVRNPATVAYSLNAFSLIDLPEAELTREEFAEYFSGNKLLPGSKTAAHCYCGHQFGSFSGQLGDGAAIYLGEVINSKGERWEIQLKGAGLTPYSRHADGRKVLRSSIREFLCSEAMHHLGIPTTRAGSCITSDTLIPRDIFYDGNVIHEKASIVMRMAPSFIRFGSFEIFKPMDRMTGQKGPSVGRTDILAKLLDYTIKTFYTEVYNAHLDNLEDRYLAFYKEVVLRTARLVAEWQCVGFCHGVLNTDNMSIVGLTIDYGPFGFMDYFNKDHICNESDADRGRYSYSAQPAICKWNLDKLAEAIKDALPLSRSRQALEELYDKEYQKTYLNKMRLKLGLLNKHLPEDEELIESLFDTMQESGADFTNTFRCLSKVQAQDQEQSSEKNEDVIKYLVSQCQTLEELQKTTQPTLGDRQLEMFLLLIQSNPHLLEQLGGSVELIHKAMEKKEKSQKLKETNPTEKLEKDSQLWTTWISKYSARLADDFRDCDDIEEAQRQRVSTMNANNPRFILRNYIAQNAISAAEKGDFSEVQRVLRLLQTPFSDNIDLSDLQPPTRERENPEVARDEDGANCSSYVNTDTLNYDSKPPDWSLDLRVT